MAGSNRPYDDLIPRARPPAAIERFRVKLEQTGLALCGIRQSPGVALASVRTESMHADTRESVKTFESRLDVIGRRVVIQGAGRRDGIGLLYQVFGFGFVVDR